MQLKAHKCILAALLLFGLGIIVGTIIVPAYRLVLQEDSTIHPAASELENEVAGLGENLFISEEFPREVAGMSRRKLLTGEDAEDIIYGILGQDFKISQAIIATYKNSEKEFMLFISEFATQGIAEKVIATMEKYLVESDSYGDIYTINLSNGTAVNYLEGEGRSSYFYYKDSRVFWVTVTGEAPTSVVEELYSTF